MPKIQMSADNSLDTILSQIMIELFHLSKNFRSFIHNEVTEFHSKSVKMLGSIQRDCIIVHSFYMSLAYSMYM